jgi:ABC-type multidrug transport system fused ATPase/permease subunit
VWFRYPTRPKQWVLRGLNLTINPKDNIALVGESGQGKSTIVLLLLRFYEAEFGEILLDGVDIRKYNLRQYRAALGLVQQEPLLFNYSIKENVLYGNQMASNAEILEACDQANVKEFVESAELENAVEEDVYELLKAMQDPYFGLKEKLGQELYDKKLKVMKKLKEQADTEGRFQIEKDILDHRTDEQKGTYPLHNGYLINCGTRGSKLSGGQKQRVAIARAIVRQPNILLLDEATSALDEESQKKVQLALEKIMKDRTSIVIAHRMTTIERCNRVAVLEDGVVAEDGSFDQLSKKDGSHFNKLKQGLATKTQKE